MSLISNLQFTGSARTTIGLLNFFNSTIANVSAYDAGEIAGWFYIKGTASYKFWFAAKFSKNGAGTDYWISPSTVGDAPPVGFNITITTAGIIQAFIPSIAGFVSASVTYSLNAPAVGVAFPLLVDGTLVSAASGVLQGTVSTTSQTFAGAKTFLAGLTISQSSSQLILGSGTTTTVSATAPAANVTYTMPDVGASANFVMDQGAQTVNGSKTFSSALVVNPVNNQLVLGATKTVTITAPTPASASLTHTIPDVGANSNFVMDQGAQTIAGVKTFSSAPVIASASGIVAASATVPGVVSISAQTIAGAKTFSSPVAVSATSAQLVLGGTTTTTLSATAPAANRTYTLPDVGNNANFVMDQGAQTIAGVKTFSSGVPISATTNQLVLGTTNTTTISATAPSASRTYTMPDVGNNANFVMDQGAQTVAGAKTLSSVLTITPTTNQLVLGTTNTTTISATAPAASRTYTMPDVGASANFVMDQGAQTIVGVKTFSSGVPISAATNQLVLGPSATSTTISATTPAASRVYTMPDVGASANFVMDQGTQTVNGAKTLSSALTINPTTNQLVLGATRTVTITAPTPASASLTHTIPDVGANANFVMDQGAQTITGAKTFSSAAAFSNTVNYLYTAITGATTLGSHYYVSASGSTTYTITLPSAVGISGRVYIVKNRASIALSVATTSSQTIDGSTPTSNNLAVNAALRLISNGTSWETF